MIHNDGDFITRVKLFGDNVPIRIEYEGHFDGGEYDWDKIDAVMVIVDITKTSLTTIEVDISEHISDSDWLRIDKAVIAAMRSDDER